MSRRPRPDNSRYLGVQRSFGASVSNDVLPAALMQKKGAVGNANKRIRRFLPSNTDLSQMSQATLNQIARILNNQPRKCLGYRTPTEAFIAPFQGEV